VTGHGGHGVGAGPAPNRVCELARIEIPIIQAPMTYIAGAQLAAAVSNAGALGIIETTSDQGRADLNRVRDLTDGSVGANIALIMNRDPAVVDLLVANGIRFVTTSAGDPSLFTDRLHDAGITVFHVVGTLAAAKKAVDAGVDGLVVEGVEGGGFKNRFGASTMVLLPLVAAHVDVPIVAAGGICDARSMAAALVLGAEGVQMGTRLLASADSPVHGNLKQAVVRADETSTVLLPLDGKRMMRVIRTRAAEKIDEASSSESLQRGGAALARVQRLYFDGDLDASVANTGQVAGRIDDILPAADIITQMWAGCREVLAASVERFGTPSPGSGGC
jgi:enoyl-[acyl-carrier protein] reductase II